MQAFYKKSIKGGFLLLLVATVITSCITYKEVQYSGIKNVAIESVSMKEIKLKITASATNPNDYKIKILNGSFDIKSEDFQFGTFKLSEKVTIPANSKGDINIYVETKVKSLFSSSLMKLMANVKGNNIPITIDGYVTAKAKLFRKKVKFSKTENISL